MRQLLRIGVPVALFSGLLLLSPLKAQQPPVPQQNPHSHSQAMPQPGGTFDFDKMMSDMRASDANLMALSMKMRAAQGDAKVLAMQDVVDELVKNQVQMHRHMMMMHDTLMGTSPQ